MVTLSWLTLIVPLKGMIFATIVAVAFSSKWQLHGYWNVYYCIYNYIYIYILICSARYVYINIYIFIMVIDGKQIERDNCISLFYCDLNIHVIVLSMAI